MMDWAGRIGRAGAFAGALLLAPMASALDQAGVSAGVRGDVKRANVENPVGLQVASGQPIFLADRISSGSQSGMQVMLLDQTSLTIGPDSFITIDEFVYDPSTGAGKVTASLGKGAFRFVTGLIAQREPANMTVKTPVALIGIRGTMAYGEATETRTTAALGGPGQENTTGDKPAGIDLIPVDNPEDVAKLRRPGFVGTVERGKPTIVQKLKTEDANRLLEAVAPRNDAQGLAAVAAVFADLSTGAATRTSGQSAATGGSNQSRVMRAEDLDRVATQSGIIAVQQAVSTGSSITTLAQLQGLTGNGIYQTPSQAGTLSGSLGGGVFDFRLNVHFGVQNPTANVLVGYIFTSGPIAGTSGGGSGINISFVNGMFNAPALSCGSSPSATGCGASFVLRNIGGVAAKQAVGTVSVNNFTGGLSSSGTTTANRP